jgi:CheY-like chemotaxis protein
MEHLGNPLTLLWTVLSRDQNVGDSYMIVGYLLVGAFMGLLASIVALFFGASFWFALGLYTLVGSAVVILLPIALVVAGLLVNRTEAPIALDRWNETGNPRSAGPSASQPGAAIKTSMSILAVDDDPFILELIPMISSKAGFSEVSPAASGEQALELLGNPDLFFDCLLLDISMPDMDGIELCRRVRQMTRYHHTPIIMLTAMRDVANMGDAYRAGATDYATKPFDIEELGTRLRLTQEAIHAQRGTSPASHESTNCNWNTVHNYDFELPYGLSLEGVESLVNHSMLWNYLTQLPRKEVADIQVLAVNIDEIEAFYTQSSPRQFAALLKDVAAASANCFGANQTVMAYTNNATLLIAVNSGKPISAFDIEFDIENLLQTSIYEHNTEKRTKICVSVGGAVQPQGAQAERARMATDRVMALAENRALDKVNKSDQLRA